ncbi:undecaprenyldiphospho-muramoylpentapeptide beta-N-acetylglucosaminyltransferase [Motilimonas pumila]|uniref:UDP-N-acetylglucosamine--N-acetylmuramyl-(pentapeptide) pyrophosphoryl-undecaprenol N-acetylglucosamine transferase n=1 Tax=Motilimonas pumila TaxID=2303987 RepID=A0A418YI80_9GAMM|nr:undecaprenyldiphospho-muramoylpentapeptide beta-N-acetylglucosaminyltransferase [Motilimonas pumila]RJG50036.1 undecaprenyldiphospho-muramoylpentapeptide beta-N-acetylglucosaminyltransferase [Motilimonas pumila]
MTAKTLVVMAGGTGGHVFPGIAVAKELAQQGWNIRWLGTADRMEAQLVPSHGFEIDFIDISGVRGNGIKRLLMAPLRIVKSIFQAKAVLKQSKADVVLGMGGFASGPGGIAAWLSGIPVVLHEQNAAAGATNRILSKVAKRVLMAFPGAFEHGQVVGNPVRHEIIEAANKRQLSENASINVLVVGGSLGARVLNQTLPQVVSQLDSTKMKVKHQTGKGNLSQVEQAYQGQAQVEVIEFIDDMAAAYQWADLVVCRAGALTVSELAVLGLPAIFVPLPHAVDDHQTKNAMSLVAHEAGLLMPQNELSVNSLTAMIKPLIEQPERLAVMASNAKQQGITDATQRVANICKELTEKNV